MNLIDRIAKLRELESNATRDWKHRRDGESFNVRSKIITPDATFVSEYQANVECDSACDDAELVVELRNAAPMLLDALDFQPGDTSHIRLALAAIEFSRRAFTAKRLTDADIDAASDCLRRYQAMAEHMEESK